MTYTFFLALQRVSISHLVKQHFIFDAGLIVTSTNLWCQQAND